MILNKRTQRSWGIIPDCVIDQADLYLDEVKEIYQFEMQYRQSDSNPELLLANRPMQLLEFLGLAGALVHRHLGIALFAEQYQGALALIRKQMVEMQTGEGKTVTIALASAWLAYSLGKSQILTFNDYLAGRDAAWMAPLYQNLGLSVAAVHEDDIAAKRKASYQANIVYSTIKTIGFDFLRNQMIWNLDELLPIDFGSVIIDEADAMLIDEARHPLVLAGSRAGTPLDLNFISDLVGSLNKDDFEVDERRHELFLTDSGIKIIQDAFPGLDLTSGEGFSIYSAVQVALQAHSLLHKDIHYLVEGDRVKLIDEFTGRVVPDRKWRNGLQAAVEAKEKVTIQMDGEVLQMISIPHLVRKYDRIAGTTATAADVAEELHLLYGVKTCIIPTHQTSQRIDLPLQICLSQEEKNGRIVEEVRKRSLIGQPVLIGTLTVRESEVLADLLTKSDISVQLLNANHDEKEAKIIAQAALPGMVTIATNMAGRGTDIRLGNGDPELHKKVSETGGLFVLGTNLHEARRIDRQLRGRAGRQGDPGGTKFIVSMTDDLMVRYHLKEIMDASWLRKDVQKMNQTQRSHYVLMVQKIIEKRLEEMRRNIAEYADFLESQRILWSRERHQYFDSNCIHDLLKMELPDAVQEIEQHIDALREILFYHYDRYWAQFLQEMMLRRDGIHLVRLGGFQPLRIFREEADIRFEGLLESCRKISIQDCVEYVKTADTLNTPHSFTRPTSTWTYIASDNPFTNQLNIRLANPGEIALQTDVFTLPLLFIKGLVDRWRKKPK